MMAHASPEPRRHVRQRLVITGLVQGVGFRPYVWRRATRLGLTGWVENDAAGVTAEVLPHVGYARREDFDAALAEAIERHAPDIVVMAGFMRVVGEAFVRRFRGRMLNIHPSLLPRHPGLRTHQAVLDAGDREHGATVHFVTEELDGGPQIIQGQFMVNAEDTAGSLAERVMQDIELKIYPQAVAWMARGELALEQGQVRFRGRSLQQPLGLQDLEAEFR